MIPGALFGASLVLLGVERFIAEFWRITPRVLGWMSAAQLFSIAAFIMGIALILWMRTRPRIAEGGVSNLASATGGGERGKSRQRNRAADAVSDGDGKDTQLGHKTYLPLVGTAQRLNRIDVRLRTT